MRSPLGYHGFFIRAAGLALLALTPAAVANAAETIVATAHVKTAAGAEATVPITVALDRLSTDAERDGVMAALRKDGHGGVRTLLSSAPKIGSVQVGATTTAVQYAYARSMGSGRLITVITGSPIAFIGAGLPGAKPKEGFDLGLLVLEVMSSRDGRGEMVPAAKVRLNDNGAIVTEDYSAETVQLSKVVGK